MNYGTDHDLDHLGPNHYEVQCGSCVIQIRPSEHALDRAGYTAPARPHELDHTDHTDDTDDTDQENIYLPCLADLGHEL